MLQKLIQHTGPITVSQFMCDALAHPQTGYYQKKDPFGQKGDFITAPEISQIFGELIGIWCALQWQQMGSPSDISLIELGPGRGTLMQDLLRGTQHIPNFHDSISICLVETSQHLTKLQQEKLESSHHNIQWYIEFSEIPNKPFIIIGNEFFDALPIHQYEKTTHGWQERLIDFDPQSGALQFVQCPNLGYSDSINVKHPNAVIGSILEICPPALNLVEDISVQIAKQGGAALFIDYGYTQNNYHNTLQAIKNHQYHSILDDIGNADITAHVDFGALADIAQSYVSTPVQVITQQELLTGLGIEQRRDSLLQKASPSQQQNIISQTNRLTHPNQMGELFKAMLITT